MKRFKHVPLLSELADALPDRVEIYAYNEAELRNRVTDVNLSGPYSHKDGEYVGIHGIAKKADILALYARSRGRRRAAIAHEIGVISENTYMSATAARGE